MGVERSSIPEAVILINELELKITYDGTIAKEAWSEGHLGESFSPTNKRHNMREVQGKD